MPVSLSRPKGSYCQIKPFVKKGVSNCVDVPLTTANTSSVISGQIAGAGMREYRDVNVLAWVELIGDTTRTFTLQKSKEICNCDLKKGDIALLFQLRPKIFDVAKAAYKVSVSNRYNMPSQLCVGTNDIHVRQRDAFTSSQNDAWGIVSQDFRIASSYDDESEYAIEIVNIRNIDDFLRSGSFNVSVDVTLDLTRDLNNVPNWVANQSRQQPLFDHKNSSYFSYSFVVPKA